MVIAHTVPLPVYQAENFNIVVGGFTTFVAGTSCASPTFSGVVSLLNDLRLQAGKSPLGYLNLLFCTCTLLASWWCGCGSV